MKRRLIGAMALLTSLTLSASAATDASLTLSNFSTTLKDLNQADGIAPSIGWSFYLMATDSRENVQQGWTVSNGFAFPTLGPDALLSSESFTPATLNQVSAYGHGTQYISSSGTGLDALTLTAHADAGQSVASSGVLAEFFTLSAGTQATFSVTVDGAWSGNAAPGQLPPAVWGAQRSNAGVYTDMSAGSLSVSTQGSGASDTSQPDAYDSEIDGQVLKLVVKNTSATDKVYYFTVNSGVYADETALPVPEPSSYAMLGAGLLVVGAIARRRRT